MILVIIFTGLTSLSLLMQGAAAAGIVGLAAAVMYFLLLTKKDFKYFYIICGLVILMMIINLSAGAGSASFGGILNPVITYLLIKRSFGK